MARQLRGILIASIFIAGVLGLIGTPDASAETYSSENDKYKSAFCNNIFGTNHNDMFWMDAIYFGGREILFFTLMSDCSPSYDSKLYFFTHNPESHSSVDISNSLSLDFRFKLVEFNNVLYIFYTTDCSSCSGFNNSTIYYRTATVNRGTDGKGWALEFSGQKSISAGVSKVKIRMAHSMEGTMYVIYSAGSNWYTIASADGLFNPATPGSLVKMSLFTAPDGITGAGGAVFQVSDPDKGIMDKLMIAYATGSTVKYLFFDGKGVYGQNAIGDPFKPYAVPNTGAADGVYPYSVRLIAGSASGYSDSKYSVQMFIASPKDSGSNQTWNNIFHREYTPAGENGDEGHWSSIWNQLNSSGDDRIKSINAYDPDPGWAVIPLFKSASQNAGDEIQMYLRIWYHRGTNYTWPSSDHVTFRTSYYTSDILYHLSQVSTGPEKQDSTTQTVLGVIEGTPPWPYNGGGGISDTSDTSWVEYGKENSYSVETDWSVGGSVMVYKGVSFKERGELKAKLSAGVKYTKTTSTTNKSEMGMTLKSYNKEPPGRLGWLVLLTPEILNDSYALYSYNRKPLFYEGDPSGDPITASLITYGNNTKVTLLSYYLDEPSFAIGGDEEHASRKFLKGMAERPFSNDLPGYVAGTTGWQGLTDYYTQMSGSQNCPWEVTDLWTLVGDNSKTMKSLVLSSTVGVSSTYSISCSTTEGKTWSQSAGFSATWDKAGFFFASGGEFDVNWTMDINTTSTMTAKLGFQYDIPDCGIQNHVTRGGRFYDCKLTHTSGPENEPGVGTDWTTYWVESATPNTATTDWVTATKYYGWCFSTANVIPKLFVPKSDDIGYDCPWISNDIRDYRKPKPWCLTYNVFLPSKSAAAESSRLTVRHADATLHLDQARRNRDRVSARLTLEGVGPDYSEQVNNLLHLGLGSYVSNSESSQVLAQTVHGDRTVIRMRQPGSPKSSIQVVLTYDEAHSLLHIALDAERVHVPGLARSLVDAHMEGNTVAFPLSFFLGSRYHAKDNLHAQLTFKKGKIICRLHDVRRIHYQ